VLLLITTQILETYRAELRDNQAGPEGDESTRAKVEMKLNSMRPQAFVVSLLVFLYVLSESSQSHEDPILVHSVNLGSSSPRLSNARFGSSQMSNSGVRSFFFWNWAESYLFYVTPGS
jgi:maintenance of mitochondrial morphology protein 1